MAGIIRTILTRFDSFSILVYILLNLSFACVELAFGIWSNSLSLISDAFHMFFDSSGMTVGLIAQAIIHANWKNELIYSYGYGRADAVAGFANACFLSFIVFMLTGEAVQRILIPPTVKTENLLQIACVGLGVNVFGLLVMFKNRRSAARRHVQAQRPSVIARHEDHDDDDHGILLGMFLHVIADALGSIGVIVSSLLIEKFGWTLADPICSLVIALFLVFGIIPLLRESIDVSMQRTPRELDKIVPSLLDSIARLPAVESVKDPHFWSLHKTYHVASCVLVIGKDGKKSDWEHAYHAARELLLGGAHKIKYCTIEMERGLTAGSSAALADPKLEKERQKKMKKDRDVAAKSEKDAKKKEEDAKKKADGSKKKADDAAKKPATKVTKSKNKVHDAKK